MSKQAATTWVNAKITLSCVQNSISMPYVLSGSASPPLPMSMPWTVGRLLTIQPSWPSSAMFAMRMPLHECATGNGRLRGLLETGRLRESAKSTRNAVPLRGSAPMRRNRRPRGAHTPEPGAARESR
ncbi:hypothetical protein G6F35_017710 [Rhizopus arrhizus]|nr:hypothetical protein G6F35_017710 [Rhizopus arrhizus]